MAELPRCQRDDEVPDVAVLSSQVHFECAHDDPLRGGHGMSDLTVRDAVAYTMDAPTEIRNRVLRLARDPRNLTKRDRVLHSIDSLQQWLTVMRLAVVEGRLGEWDE